MCLTTYNIQVSDLYLLCCCVGGGNIRPAGHIRPAKANFFSFDFTFLTEMWPARH